MNLHAIASPIVAAVNPRVPATLQVSTGYSTDPTGKRIPTYAPTASVEAQVQSLTFRDIQQISGLNLQGLRRGIYLFGDIEGLVRSQQKGGDLISFGTASVPAELQNTIWLVAMVLETWPGWCKVACTLQNNS